jgi:DNA-binding response OmpR family regulator
MAKTIMVLEDEAMLFELLNDLLKLEGYQVSSAVPETLLQDLYAKKPAALLMDVNLRGANGLDLLSKIRADEALKDLVVVLSSGLDFRQESLQRGADGFILKPYMPDELINTLKSKLAN